MKQKPYPQYAIQILDQHVEITVAKKLPNGFDISDIYISTKCNNKEQSNLH